MGKLVILHLPEGDFQRGFACTVQVGFDESTIETRAQITGRLPANPDMPQKLNDEWRRIFNLDENSRIKAKQAGITNFSKSNAVNNFIEHLNNWLNNSTYSEWQKIRDFLQQSLNNEEEIRVIIQTQDPILRRLPWQAWNLFADNYPKAEIALSPTTFATPGDLPPSNSNLVRILVVLGSSTVADGSQEIDITFDQKELENLTQEGAFLKFLEQPDPQELRDCLWLEEGWDIFFFAGHSFSSDDGTVGEIILNARAQGLKITELFEALKKAISRGLQLAIFNSCDGLGLANQLAELNIRQMIVMREPVPDAVAKTFLKHFLTALACNNQSLYASVREARSRLGDLKEQYPGAKYLPVICQNPAVIPPTWKKLRTGRRIHAADWNPNCHLSREEYQKRQVLLSKVRNFWVEGVLEKRLHGRVLLELGLEERLDAVNHPWGMVWETPNQLRQTLAPGTRVIDKFDEMAFCRTLLILGEPGSGKTITLLSLARDLINRAEIDVNQPIPVVLNLSSWGSEKLKQTIADWLAQELQRSYKVSKKYALFLIKSQKLLLILDGLDEVKEERRNLCVQALNQFRQDYGESEIVIASRIRDYERLNYRLDLQSAIYLQPLTRKQINYYFDIAGSQLAAVRNLWQEDETLQELAQSPLMLDIMTLAYQGLESEDLPIIDSIEGRRKHLFDKYIERMFQRRFKKERYKKEDSMRWLIWLAHTMSMDKETVFLIESMQPSWLLNKTHEWVYRIVFVLAVGIIFHLIGCFLISLTAESIFLPSLYSDYGSEFYGSEFTNNTTIFEKFIILFMNWKVSFVLTTIIAIINMILIKFQKTKEIKTFEKINLSLFKIYFIFIKGAFFGLIIGILNSAIHTLASAIFMLLSLIQPSLAIIILPLLVIITNPLFIIITSIIITCFYIYRKKILAKISKNQILNNHSQELIINNYSFNIKYLERLIFLLVVSFQNSSGLSIRIFALFCGLISILCFGLRGDELEKKAFPNQGIYRSSINAAIFGLIGGLILGIINKWTLDLEQELIALSHYTNYDVLGEILNYGIFWGLILALIPGLSVIKHITLRIILYFKKYIPWNYARFLDYATERIFLQKVGGGYIFIHRLLQEHFASLKLD